MSAATVASPLAGRSQLARMLLADGVLCLAMGALLIVSAGPLGDLFDLPTLLLRIVGAGLLPWAAAVLFIATRPVISEGSAWLVVAGNLVWVIASATLLFSGWVDPSALGVAFIVTQAVVVAVVASVQVLALRRQH